MESNLSLKKPENKQITRKRWYINKLKDEEIRYNYSEEVNNNLKELLILQQNEPYGLNDEWESLKTKRN